MVFYKNNTTLKTLKDQTKPRVTAYLFQLRKSFPEKTKRALEETRWLAAQVLRAALQVDDFISSPGRLGSIRWGHMLPCLRLVLSCSLSDSSFPLYSVDVNLTSQFNSGGERGCGTHLGDHNLHCYGPCSATVHEMGKVSLFGSYPA